MYKIYDNNISEEMSLVMEPDQLEIYFPDYQLKKRKDINFSLNGTAKIKFEHKFYNVNENKQYDFEDSKTHAISFFSGAGGLDIGTQLAGVKVISSLDFDRDSVLTMKKNKFFNHSEHILNDINKVKGIDYKKIIKQNNPEKLILVGGPPCQPFSKAGYWKTHENRLGNDDPRNMIGQYLRIIEEIKPDGFILENVESLLHPTNKIAIDGIMEALDKLGYSFIIYKANGIEFGVPQKRKRVFVIASKKKKIKGEPSKTHGSPTEIIHNSNLQPYEPVINWIGKFNDAKYFDKDELSLGKYEEDLFNVPPGKNYIALTARNNYPNPKFIAGKRYWTFLLKLHPLEPSWTIISQPGHYEGPFHWTSRRLRLEEIAGIQTFPEDYLFCGSRRSVHKQIGNAVPPLLGKAMIKFLISQI